jgi:hypothetical protein
VVSRLPRIRLDHGKKRYAGLACGAVSIGVVGALLLGPSPVTPGAPPDQDPPAGSIVGKEFEDVATAELTGARSRANGLGFAPRRLIVRFESRSNPSQRAKALASIDAVRLRRLPSPETELITLEGSTGVREAARTL